MSSEIINESLIEAIIEKIKKEHSLRDNKDVAQLIGISAQNFSLKKKRGTLINDMLAWAIAKNQDLNYLFKIDSELKGKGKAKENPKNRKFDILNEIEEWLGQEVEKDPKNEIWFQIQIEKSVTGFKKWKEEKQGVGRRDEEFLPVLSAAGGGGK